MNDQSDNNSNNDSETGRLSSEEDFDLDQEFQEESDPEPEAR